MKILLADDEELCRTNLADKLRMLGFDVIEAKDGSELLKIYAADKPDLILTDINMPLITGLEAIKQIRKTDGSIPVIVLTIHHDKYLLDELLPYCNAYLFKERESVDDFLETLFQIQAGKDPGIRKYVYDVIKRNKMFENIQLTKREVEVAKEIANGITSQQAADKLFLCRGTIEKHLTSIYRKLGISSKYNLTQLVNQGKVYLG